MYTLFTRSCRLHLHLVKVVVRISMHDYVSLAQTKSWIMPQCQGITTQIASCTRTVENIWHIMSLTAASPVLQALPEALQPQLIISIRPLGAAWPVASEGDGSPLFMSHPNLVMSKMGGPCRSAAFHNVTCRWTLFMWSSRFASVGGNAIIRSGSLSSWCRDCSEPNSSKFLPSFWPYMVVKNRWPVSISSASVAFSSPDTSYRAVNYPAFRIMFKALILP